MGLPSIGTFLGGIGALSGKASTYIPGRVEKLKNEKVALKKEKEELEKGKWDEKKGQRSIDIGKRIDTINELLGNKAQD